MKISEDVLKVLNIGNADLISIEIILEKSGYGRDLDLEIVLLLLFSGKNEGSTCIIVNSGNFMNKIKALAVNFDAENFISKIKKGIYGNLISDDINNYKPLIIRSKDNSHYIYFHKYYKNELILKDLIGRFIHKESHSVNNDAETAKILKSLVYKDPGIPINDKQKIAVVSALLNDFLIISGGPGSGKTTAIIYIILSLVNYGFALEDIALAAPTGKASKMLKESFLKINDSGFDPELITISTIHKLLKYNPSKKSFSYNDKNRLLFRVIIIDEVSMVDLIIMKKLLESINDRCKLILSGDKDQLPSVDVGTVFSDLIPAEKDSYYSSGHIDIFKKAGIELELKTNESKLKDKIVILDGNNRTKNHKIRDISLIINSSNTDPAALFDKRNITDKDIFFNGGFIQIKPHKDKRSEINFLIRHWFDRLFFSVRINDMTFSDAVQFIKKYDFDDERNITGLELVFRFLNYARILTIVNSTVFGSVYINDMIYEYYLEKAKISKTYYLASGTPVMITSNDYVNGLFNGDNGIVLEDRSHARKFFFKSFRSYKSFNIEKISSFDLNYAMTVHKSQGSGYNNILMILPDDIRNRLLTKEIIYTGITRAIDSIAIYADDEIIKKAVSTGIERQSGIDYWG